MIEKNFFTKEDYEKLKEEQENLKQDTLKSLNRRDELVQHNVISTEKAEQYKELYSDFITKNDALIELCKLYLAK